MNILSTFQKDKRSLGSIKNYSLIIESIFYKIKYFWKKEIKFLD